MLSRTAENLFWIARYIERAETMARLLEVGYRMAMMPSIAQGYRSEWASILAAAGSADGFTQKYGETPRQADVEAWLFFDRDNPASVVNCVEHARQNGRAVRTALTSEVWDALNGGWLDLAPMSAQPRSSARLPELCDWTKRLGAQVRGAIEGTLQRREGYDFINLGYFVERGDNTARLIDVKYFVLLPTTDMVGGSIDSYQWTTLLRAVSAYRAFHWAYGGEYTPAKIAHFLILNPACPRSLLHCLDELQHHLGRLISSHGASTSAHSLVTRLRDELAAASIEDVLDEGLHEFLTRHIDENAQLGAAIANDYLFGAH
jgi:uncharacterized alpha-E superfamily protein